MSEGTAARVTTTASRWRAVPGLGWLIQQPYLLLALTSLVWAGNLVLGRFVVGHFPPFTLSCLRWAGALPIILPMAWPHLRRDWPAIRRAWPMLTLLSATGFAANNVLAYSGLQFTQALNGLLIQSSGPLFVALWSLMLFGIRLSAAQTFGIAISLGGVLTILLHGDLATILRIHLNKGDVMLTLALVVFGAYSAMMPKRPQIHPLSLFACTIFGGALLLAPLMIWEIARGHLPVFDVTSALSLGYVIVFPSIIGYLCLNRGIALIGPNRAAPFIHLIPVFGSAMAILSLGERLELFHIVGYALVLGGISIASRRTAPARP
jgi:drug/metabolite transporter (DMT)-like permease